MSTERDPVCLVMLGFGQIARGPNERMGFLSCPEVTIGNVFDRSQSETDARGIVRIGKSQLLPEQLEHLVKEPVRLLRNQAADSVFNTASGA